MKYIIYNKSSEDMSDIKSDSIASVFTSPPYALAKNYGDTDGIGMSTKVSAYKGDYIPRMFKVFKEMYRVMMPGRYVGVNIADVIQTDKKSSHKKPIQFHFYTLLRKAGFEYKDVIIWKKPIGMSTQKRFGVFIQNPYPMYYHPNNIYEPILVFKKPGHYEVTDKQKEENKLNYKDFLKYQSDVWEIHPETNVKHEAPFPYFLPKIFFSLYAFKGETVLDMFLGSGSSMLAARLNRQHCIGYEINGDYIELIKERCGFAKSNQMSMEAFDKNLKSEDVLEVLK